MLRVFQFSNITIGNVHILHKTLMTLDQSRHRRCLCKTLNIERRITGPYSCVTKHSRNRSTNVSTLLFDKSSKKKRIKRKLYTELLEVSNNSASERRAKIKTVDAHNIAKLPIGSFTSTLDTNSLENVSLINDMIDANIKSIDVLASEKDELALEEVEEIVYQNQEFSEEVTLPSNEIINGNTVGEPSSASKSHKINNKLTLSRNAREALSKVNYAELDAAGRERSLASLLIAYIDACVSCGFTNRALAVLNNYLKNKDVNIIDVKVFEALLSGYTRNGNIEKFLELWHVMNNLKVSQSTLSYGLRIECIARSCKRDKVQLLNKTLGLMFNEGISINKLFVDIKWKGDSREIVLEAVKAVRPNFMPFVPKPDLNYSNPLVDGLNNVQKSTSFQPAEGLINIEELKILFNEQLNRETDLYVKVRSIERVKSSDLTQDCRDKIHDLRNNWEKIILSSFQRDLAALNSLHHKVRRTGFELNIYPYLTVLDKHDYKDIIINEIFKLADGSDSFGQSLSFLYKELGYQVRIRYENKLKNNEGLINKLRGVYYEYGRWYLSSKTDSCINGRQKWKSIVHKYQKGPSLDFEIPPWPTNVLVCIGKFLFNIIMSDIKIDMNIMKKNINERLLPAFFSVQRRSNNYILKEDIKPHPILARLFRGACLPMLTFNVAEVPMVIPPIPWSSINCGGYVIAKTNLLRLPNQAVLQWERLKTSPQSQIYPCLDSLNQLGSVPWKVNKEILDIVIKVFNDGGNSKLAIPEPPTAFPMPQPEETPPATKEEQYQAYRRRMIAKRKKAEMYSLWCDARYKLSLANHFRDKIFWLPHNMDFRGRVYPCPPHLNHLSSDMSRSLLCFAKGEPLGKDGLDWLKIHVVNLTGLKKRDSIAERLAFGNSIISLIIDSAEGPFKGKKWWMESEEPWQTLATCIEIRNALSHPEGPEKYICHFPVHQDGSCNGLQHYAALGRDSIGASSVNLSQSERPQDVYSCVAAIVERERAKDALNGVQIAQVLDGYVKRKVIKQTVMTTVYGVTRFGARLQIAKQLKDIDGYPKDYVWQGSSYLVTKTFASLREMFTSTREIQDWLTQSARYISLVCSQNVEYVTPIGLPVVQPYSRISKSSTSTFSSTNLSSHYAMDMFEKPNVMKQRNAFPPNFIHSLDSTHMMLTSLHCEQAGITFVSVHDCFWTHPSAVHIMNKICREQFVSLHTQPILKNLSEFLVNKYSYNERDEEMYGAQSVTAAKRHLHLCLKRVPTIGDFDLSDVLKSVYFFS